MAHARQEVDIPPARGGGGRRQARRPTGRGSQSTSEEVRVEPPAHSRGGRCRPRRAPEGALGHAPGLHARPGARGDFPLGAPGLPRWTRAGEEGGCPADLPGGLSPGEGRDLLDRRGGRPPGGGLRHPGGHDPPRRGGDRGGGDRAGWGGGRRPPRRAAGGEEDGGIPVLDGEGREIGKRRTAAEVLLEAGEETPLATIARKGSAPASPAAGGEGRGPPGGAAAPPPPHPP